MTEHVVNIRRNRASAAEVAAHLRVCDRSFVPPLSERVEVDAYAQRIVAHAERFEAWSDDHLAGLVAVYCNDLERRAAFVTSVSVLPFWRAQGLASRLLQACVDHVRQVGFERLELEVDSKNTAATLLYRKHGFALTGTHEATQILHLAL
jgi:ribosomal protein S18 acetylase RimI-like enzyme